VKRRTTYNIGWSQQKPHFSKRSRYQQLCLERLAFFQKIHCSCFFQNIVCLCRRGTGKFCINWKWSFQSSGCLSLHKSQENNWSRTPELPRQALLWKTLSLHLNTLEQNVLCWLLSIEKHRRMLCCTFCTLLALIMKTLWRKHQKLQRRRLMRFFCSESWMLLCRSKRPASS